MPGVPASRRESRRTRPPPGLHRLFRAWGLGLLVEVSGVYCIHLHTHIHILLYRSYICIYIYMYVPIYIYIYLFVYLSIYLFMFIYLFICLFIHSSISTHMCMCIQYTHTQSSNTKLQTFDLPPPASSPAARAPWQPTQGRSSLAAQRTG